MAAVPAQCSQSTITSCFVARVHYQHTRLAVTLLNGIAASAFCLFAFDFSCASANSVLSSNGTLSSERPLRDSSCSRVACCDQGKMPPWQIHFSCKPSDRSYPCVPGAAVFSLLVEFQTCNTARLLSSIPASGRFFVDRGPSVCSRRSHNSRAFRTRDLPGTEALSAARIFECQFDVTMNLT